MLYQISRAGQLYGPYTLEDIQRYITQGNILPTDLAKSEEMPGWIPVSQLLGTSTVPVAPSAYPIASYAPAAYTLGSAAYPDPPNLHWALVLLFGLLTCGIFTFVWDLVQVLWLKKVVPNTKAFLYFLIFIGVEIVNLALSFGKLALIFGSSSSRMVLRSPGLSALSFIVSISVLVVVILYRFTMRNDLELHFNGPDPIGLRLGGVMTFFFGGLYFQYHFNRINEIKQAIRYRNATIPPQ
jgi:hypothetical protein